MRALLEAGVAVEAGIWTVEDVYQLAATGLAEEMLRICVEPVELDPTDALAFVEEIHGALDEVGLDRPRLQHGDGAATWILLSDAIHRGIDTRIGLEDTLLRAGCTTDFRERGTRHGGPGARCWWGVTDVPAQRSTGGERRKAPSRADRPTDTGKRLTDRPLETFITLVLEHVDPRLAEAHRDLYPERVAEHIPLSMTLLYPWIPQRSVTERDLEELRTFFAQRRSLSFDLVSVAELADEVGYAVPRPDAELRAMMRALWAEYPEYPPYRQRGSDPPPHCTLGRLKGEFAISREEAEARVAPLLPVHCVVEEATLMEEFAVDRCRVRAKFPFGRS